MRPRRFVPPIVYVVLAVLFVAGTAVLPGLALPVPSRLCTTDPVQAKALAGLANFDGWLRRNDASGFIGEVGWPSTRDSPQWNALADRWYTAADRIGLPVTAWAAGPWPPGYPMAVYRPDADPTTGRSDADTAGPQATVVEAHPSTNRYLRGVDLAGGSFAAGDTNGDFGTGNPGRYGTDYRYETPSTYTDLARHGVRLVRLTVTWERLQPVPFGPLSQPELARVRAALHEADRAGLSVVLDLHGYGDYAQGGGTQGPIRHILLGSPALPTTALADFWHRTAASVAGAPNLAAFGLLNEPTHLAAPDRAGALIWEHAAQHSVDAIRTTGATTPVTVSGYLPIGPGAWGQMHPHAWIHDPLHRVAYESHAYFDSDGSGRYDTSYASERQRLGNRIARCHTLTPLPGRYETIGD